MRGSRGQAVQNAVDRMAESALRVESALQPSYLRRLLWGVNRECCRAVVAASLEESDRLRRILLDTIRELQERGSAADGNSGSGDEAARAFAMIGTCERLRELIDKWRTAANQHLEGIIGSDETLLGATKRFRSLARDIKNPASGLV